MNKYKARIVENLIGYDWIPSSYRHQSKVIFHYRVFAENLVGLGFLWSVSYIKPIPTHGKMFAVGKSGPNATFKLIFLGLGWPSVGELVGLIIILTRYMFSKPTEFWYFAFVRITYHM